MEHWCLGTLPEQWWDVPLIGRARYDICSDAWWTRPVYGGRMSMSDEYFRTKYPEEYAKQEQAFMDLCKEHRNAAQFTSRNNLSPEECSTCTTMAERLSWESGKTRLPSEKEVTDWCEDHRSA